MTTEQLKELYATGEWMCVATDIECGNWGVIYFPQDDDFNSPYLQEYKLIHKKHSEVLDHVLNGGEVECISEVGNYTEDIYNFINGYDYEDKYEIIKDKPSLNNGSLEHEVHIDMPPLKSITYTLKPKPVERITREEAHKHMEIFIGDAFQQRRDINYRWFIPKLFDYIEYLESNQKG